MSTPPYSRWFGPEVTTCAICFQARTEEDLVTDEDGFTWDVCKGQCAELAGIVERVEVVE